MGVVACADRVLSEKDDGVVVNPIRGKAYIVYGHILSAVVG